MQLDPKDKAFLWDMLDAARAVLQFIQGRPFEALLSDRMLRGAVERHLEIIGEAARRVSGQAKDGIPDIPWTSIIGLRNVIAHEYGEIQYEKVWNVCTNRLPALIARIEETGVDEPPPEGEA